MWDLFNTQKEKKRKRHFIHKHTEESWMEMKGTLPKRKSIILNAFVEDGAGTDRQIMERCNFSEPNMVRPSITALVQDGMLEEIGSTKCHITGKKVRLVDLPKIAQ